jgi:predicted DNA-binding transcriptional regulator AlpA
MSTPQNTRALTEAQAAQYIQFSRSFLRQSRMDGDRENRTPGPKWIKCGKRSVRYLRDDLDTWLEQFRQGGE